MSISRVGALIHTDRDAAKKLILAAFENAQGDRGATAVALKTTLRTFYRLIERLDLWSEIDAIVETKGFPKVPGPQRAAKKIRNLILAAEGDLARAARSAGMKPASLEARISELSLWDEINKVLRAANLPPLVKPRRRNTAA